MHLSEVQSEQRQWTSCKDLTGLTTLKIEVLRISEHRFWMNCNTERTLILLNVKEYSIYYTIIKSNDIISLCHYMKDYNKTCTYV